MAEGFNDDGQCSGEIILFGKYELGKLIGCGAFAKVYHARNVCTGQSVAIKAVSKQKVVKGGMMTNIKREISIMRRLRHPNIVKLYEVLATKAKIYFVMEYAKGGELFAKISKGRFSEEISRRYFQQLISAVGYCHSLGVFHRDLKPENLLLDENSNLKVSDFGLSAVKDQIRHDGLLHTLCGTPAYVAPELLVKKGYHGAMLDIWSCGVVLFVLIAGYLPFNDYNLMVMYRKIYRGEFRCPRWTSPELNRFLRRLLDTNPVTRITIDEIVHDPWFKLQDHQKKMNFDFQDFVSDFKDFGNNDNEKFLNAFDIISFSSGFNLSGLFSDYNDISVCGERFLSAEKPEKILQRAEEVAKTEDDTLVITRKEWGAKLEGYKGNFVLIIEIYRLTDNLVVVETRMREGPREVGPSGGLWKDKLRSQLSSLIYEPVDTVTETSP